MNEKTWWGELRSAVHGASVHPADALLTLDVLLEQCPIEKGQRHVLTTYIQAHLTHWLPGTGTPPEVLSGWLRGDGHRVLACLSRKRSDGSKQHPFVEWFGLMRSIREEKRICFKHLSIGRFDAIFDWLRAHECFEPESDRERDARTVTEVKAISLLRRTNLEQIRRRLRGTSSPTWTPSGKGYGCDTMSCLPGTVRLYRFAPTPGLPRLDRILLHLDSHKALTLDLTHKTKWNAIEALSILELIWVLGGFQGEEDPDVSCVLLRRGGEGKFMRGLSAYTSARTLLRAS